MRIEATQEGVIKGQLVDMIKDHSDKLSYGFAIEPNKRLVRNTRTAG
jgi:hypothetical protein